jgi:hypothetical protein
MFVTGKVRSIQTKGGQVLLSFRVWGFVLLQVRSDQFQGGQLVDTINALIIQGTVFIGLFLCANKTKPHTLNLNPVIHSVTNLCVLMLTSLLLAIDTHTHKHTHTHTHTHMYIYNNKENVFEYACILLPI